MKELSCRARKCKLVYKVCAGAGDCGGGGAADLCKFLFRLRIGATDPQHAGMGTASEAIPNRLREMMRGGEEASRWAHNPKTRVQSPPPLPEERSAMILSEPELRL